MIAKEVMDSHIVTVHEKTTVEEVFEMSRVRGTADFVVVDSDLNYCGMLFETELLNKLYSETEKVSLSSNVEFPKILKEELRKTSVHKFMSSRLQAFTPLETIEHMAELMLFEKISKMAVVDHGTKVVGIVSLSKILSHLMNQLTEQNAAEQKHRLSTAESGKPEADQAKNKRFFQRVPFGAPVAYRLVHGSKQEVSEGKIAQAVNVSAGGLLILAKERLVPGHTLNVALDLYQNNKPLRMVCRVVRCLPSSQEGCFEVGLMFLSMGIDERRRLEVHLTKQSSDAEA
ncbi:MAG TPA: CBS domain-containing protein [Candidatus Omnitrophota bacterium]|nr:CBS domain-containing protein [Candidatus Omnitrophota bacterium]